MPSRYTGNKRHTVCLAYVPVTVPAHNQGHGLVPNRGHANVGWPLGWGAPYAGTPEVRRILNWCCGPRVSNTCVPGARTVYPCAHALATMFLAGMVGRDPDTFSSTWAKINVLDCGARSAMFNGEVAEQHYG
jgi:hypothetical protein